MLSTRSYAANWNLEVGDAGGTVWWYPCRAVCSRRYGGFPAYCVMCAPCRPTYLVLHYSASAPSFGADSGEHSTRTPRGLGSGSWQVKAVKTYVPLPREPSRLPRYSTLPTALNWRRKLHYIDALEQRLRNTLVKSRLSQKPLGLKVISQCFWTVYIISPSVNKAWELDALIDRRDHMSQTEVQDIWNAVWCLSVIRPVAIEEEFWLASSPTVSVRSVT